MKTILDIVSILGFIIVSRYQLSGLLTGLRVPQLLYGEGEKIDYTDAKGIVEAVLSMFNLHSCQFRREQLEPYVDPWDAASVFRGEQRIGTLGRLHPEVAASFDFKWPVYIFELDFDLLHQMQEVRPFYRQLPRFPAVVRDMALVVAEASSARPAGFYPGTAGAASGTGGNV